MMSAKKRVSNFLKHALLFLGHKNDASSSRLAAGENLLISQTYCAINISPVFILTDGKKENLNLAIHSFWVLCNHSIKIICIFDSGIHMPGHVASVPTIRF